MGRSLARSNAHFEKAVDLTRERLAGGAAVSASVSSVV